MHVNGGSFPSFNIVKTITSLRKKKGMTKLKMVPNFKDEMIRIYFSSGENPKNVE